MSWLLTEKLTMTKHTSLKSSRIISTALPELESEYVHCLNKGDKYYGVLQGGGFYEEEYPALTLQELIDAIQLWGEKCGWEDVPCDVSDTAMCSGALPEQHRLLDIYLKTKDLSSEEIDSFIRNTFEV